MPSRFSQVFPGRRAVRRLLVIVAAVALVWMLAYVVAVNFMLRSGALERLVNGGTPDMQMKIGPGWSIWPGRVHVERLQLRFQDRNIQFSVAVENAVVDVSLLEVPSKTIHIERVRGDNVVYLFRHKVEDPKGLEKRLAGYPKIEGFSDPPVITQQRKPPLTDEEYNLWTVRLDDADVQVRELWFQEYRFVGRARATGGFRLEPQRDAQTDPCNLELTEGTLTAGPHAVANRFRGRIAAQLDRHDPRKVQGEAIFERISLGLDLRGELPNLQVSELYTDPQLNISRGAGELRIQTDFRLGKWAEGSKVRYTTDGLTVRKDTLTVSGPLELEARITAGGEDSRVELSADVPRASLQLRGAPAALDAPAFRRVRATLGATANLAKPMRVTSFAAEGRAIASDLRWLNHPLEQPQLFRGGDGEVNAKLEWAEGKLGIGNVEVDLEKAAFVLLQQPAVVSVRLVATGSYDANTARGQTRKLQLDLSEVDIGKERLPGGLQLRSERLQWQGLPPDRLEGRVELTAQTLKQLVPLIISSEILQAVAKAIVDLGPTRAVAEVKRTPAAWELRLEHAKSGEVEAFGQLRAEHDISEPCGRWYVQDGSIRVGIQHTGGETSVEPFVSPSWWREQPVTALCKPAKTAARVAPAPVRLSARGK